MFGAAEGPAQNRRGEDRSYSPVCRVCLPPESTPRGSVPVGVRPLRVSTLSLSSLRTRGIANRRKHQTSAYSVATRQSYGRADASREGSTHLTGSISAGKGAAARDEGFCEGQTAKHTETTPSSLRHPLRSDSLGRFSPSGTLRARCALTNVPRYPDPK